MQGPVAMLLDGGRRLHLQHGPIDLIIGAEGADPDARPRAFAAAEARFQTVLNGLAADLRRHRTELTKSTPRPADPVARRMYRASARFLHFGFLTPMIAVAGSVADEILAAMLSAGPLKRAYVNNGGDIAVHLDPDAEFIIAMASDQGADIGRVRITGRDSIGGIATSGAGGRSFSLGIAESVTVLARDGATADAAATLIANAVDLPDHPGIGRLPARELQPDSDLGDRLVVRHVPQLDAAARAAALAAGEAAALQMMSDGLILGASLFLQGDAATVGAAHALKEIEHV